MDFRQLESFVEIVKRKSFTKAAKNLYLAQPTLTGHIQALEEELGTVLLNRTGRSIFLTEAGEILYNHAVNILNMREQTFYSLSAYQGKLHGELAIAASTVPQNYLLPQLLAAFSQDYPGVSFELGQFDSQEVLQAIMSGSADFGFVGTATAYRELDMLRLCSDNLILVAAPEKSFGAGVEGTLTWEQIRACRFILREEGSATGGVFLEALEKRGIDLEELDVVARIENPNTIKQCVREGLGVAFLSQWVVQEEIKQGLLKGYVMADLDLSRDFYFISHKRRVLDPLSRAFKEFICVNSSKNSL
ncbi:MAG TPA: LysR family transcriptional regulator [Firmicutes bacterium]|nr:LysR family transcriptional regulator [Bacillota bacterium]